jgi:hypothetical protein
MNARQSHLVARAEAGLVILKKPEHQAVWKDKKPLRFTKLTVEVAELAKTIKSEAGKQGLALTGSAKDKKRERKELVDSADTLAKAMTRCLRSVRNEAEADKWDLTTTEWRNLPDLDLSEKAELLALAAAEVAQGPQKDEALDYGIDEEAAAATEKERMDFVVVMRLPVSSLAGRKVVTLGLPALLKQLREKLGEMKDLIQQFRKAAGGEALITAFREATKNRLGNGGGDDEEDNDEETPPPAPPAG